MMPDGGRPASAPQAAKTAGIAADSYAAAASPAILSICERCFDRLTGGSALPGQAFNRLNIIGRDSGGCYICRGVFNSLDAAALLPVEELKNWEYSTFWAGSRLEFGMLAREEEVAALMDVEISHSIKVEINRELGLRIASITGREGKISSPDMLIIVDLPFMTYLLEPSSIFIYGRYRKYVRGIPQTKWPCRKCHGKGCSHCGGLGKMYETSVEEIIAAPVIRETGGSSHYFHGMGREDIDAVMLGEGRPFILEISRPRRRYLDLESLEATINAESKPRVEVSALRYSSKTEVVGLKAATPSKSYVVRFRILGKINKEKLVDLISEFSGKMIAQRTPLRVVHRRADVVRERRLIDCRLLEFDGDEATVQVTAQSGTYIKEFVTGDEGRTVPNISGALGLECRIVSLDVLEVSTGAGEQW
ncbi:MAG: tRNA pseudouridine(54/55) synthase Pus10 [Thermoplasmata archaeon]|nr:tRNA pseudouridine(54/55) synthase Pus10 [Candidatus Sysuiplasma jiujiangense]